MPFAVGWPMNGRALLAWNVRKARAERGISQEKLAADSGIDRAYLSEIETEKANVGLDVLDRLANCLGLAIAELLAKPEPQAEQPQPLKRGRKAAR